MGQKGRKLAETLSAIQVKRLAAPGMHHVGHVVGLAMLISVTGAKSWTMRYSVGARRREMGLGSYPSVTLADACQRAREARELLHRGVDPIEDARARRAAMIEASASIMTFDQCASKYIDAHESGWRNPKHAAQWRATLNTYASPIVGRLPVSSIDTAHIMRILDPIWRTKAETASRLRGRIENVLDWARVRGYRQGENPARWRGHLDKLLPARAKVQGVEHHAALPYAEIGDFMVRLRKAQGMGARALEFAILTAARSGEVRGSRWAEIDLDARQWTVPGERMKAGREHRVPLSDAAIALLQQIPRMAGNDLVFPAARGGPLSDATLSAVLRRMKVDAVPHGFRSTFRDWAAERTAYPTEVAEMALAHTVSNRVEAAYRRGDLLAKRVRLMSDWATFCGKPSAKAGAVHPIRGAA